MNKISLKELYLTYPVEDLFYQLTKDLIIKINKKEYPNWIFYFNKNNICIFEYNKKNKYFLCSHSNYWTIFMKKFNFNYNQIKEITKDIVENYFNLKEITIEERSFVFHSLIENHFRL